MATRLPDRERLQPALLDRLIDEAPHEDTEPLTARVISKQKLRDAVLRDLSWLLNAVCPPGVDAARFPDAAQSVLNFGLPPLSGSQAATLDVADLEQNIKRAVLTFEPRILPDTLRVRALEHVSVLETHNQIAIELSGFLWSQPVPLEVLIRTELDLETGQVKVRDQNRTIT
jgi:type VI secretion system protein ImpF